MRFIKPLIAVAAVGAALAVASPAMAYGHYYHGGPRVGIVVGAGFGAWYAPYYGYGPGYGPYYPYGYGYAPPVVYSAPAPVQYVEQGQQQAGGGSAQAPGAWYYCNDPQGYYPYVQQCRAGWQRVSPTPQQ
jgi:hypothetical protein